MTRKEANLNLNGAVNDYHAAVSLCNYSPTKENAVRAHKAEAAMNEAFVALKDAIKNEPTN